MNENGSVVETEKAGGFPLPMEDSLGAHEGGDDHPCNDYIRVLVRVSPPNGSSNERSTSLKRGPGRGDITHEKEEGKDGKAWKFSFSAVLSEESRQEDVYCEVQDVIHNAVTGSKNACILTYGQTGSGKSYSVIGEGNGATTKESGILPRALEAALHAVQASGASGRVSISMLEIYLEKVYDLLNEDGGEAEHLRIQEQHGIVKIPDLSVVEVEDDIAGAAIISRGLKKRAISSTKMNSKSSRSHCVFVITMNYGDEKGREDHGGRRSSSSTLYIVDLAGSEKCRRTGSIHDNRVLDEAKFINASLTALGKVVSGLANVKTTNDCGGGGSTLATPPGTEEKSSPPPPPSSSSPHIPYRDSKLTRVLQPVLNGKTDIVLLLCCNGSVENEGETLSTLKFGSLVSSIKYATLTKRQKMRGGGGGGGGGGGEKYYDMSMVDVEMREEVTSLRAELAFMQKQSRQRRAQIDRLRYRLCFFIAPLHILLSIAFSLATSKREYW